MDVLPLGSGALAGTALPLDREALARDLGFAAVSENALDAVMDRDFAVEFVFACAQLQTHLARLAEDLIHFSGPEYGFVTLPEAFTTGSSLMPQKKNPDALELVRGKAARVDGDLLRLLVLLKGLPAGYQKDLQEDKEAVFDAADTDAGSVAVMTGVVAGPRPRARGHARAPRRAEEMMAAGLAVALAREGHALPQGPPRGRCRSWPRRRRTARSLKAVAAERLPAVSPGGGRAARRALRPARGGQGEVAPGRRRSRRGPCVARRRPSPALLSRRAAARALRA